ncbi:hypothetical protein L7F22_027100 [Adiantum nelumboides]|nr:hypothetical protein [Adiantum nelumboides]
MDVNGRSNLDLGPLAHLGVWALKFASVQSYKHFIAEFQNCSFNNTYLLEATEENKIKVLGKDFGGWAKTKEANGSVREDAKDGSKTPFFSEKDFKEAFSEMALGENLANFDSFPSSEEEPFKFNMIGNFGRQKVYTDADQDYSLISRNGGRVSLVHLGIRLHMSLDQEEVQVHAVDSSPLSEESEGSSVENREALFSNIEVCKPETEAGHGRWLCASQLMDPLIEQRSTLKAQVEAAALILSNGKKNIIILVNRHTREEAERAEEFKQARLDAISQRYHQAQEEVQSMQDAINQYFEGAAKVEERVAGERQRQERMEASQVQEAWEAMEDAHDFK